MMARASVRTVVRDVVAEAAPDELVVLDGLSGLEDGQVTRTFRRRRAPREPLGFGGMEVSVLVTPVVWLVVNEAVRHATARAVDGAVERALPRVRAAVRRLLRRPPAPSPPVPPLSAGQLAEVHRQVLDRAGEAGVEETEAAALADAVVSRLARADEGGQDEG
jgi:hypothetical protein